MTEKQTMMVAAENARLARENETLRAQLNAAVRWKAELKRRIQKDRVIDSCDICRHSGETDEWCKLALYDCKMCANACPCRDCRDSSQFEFFTLEDKPC